MYHAPGSYYSPKRIVNDEKAPVAINNFSFCVGNRVYPFDIISKFGLSTIAPNRKPGIAMIVLGALMALIGFFKSSCDASITILGQTFSQLEVLGTFSVALCTSGLIAISIAAERYTVRLTIGTEEVDAIVSRKKNYARRIIAALNKAAKKNEARIKKEAA